MSSKKLKVTGKLMDYNGTIIPEAKLLFFQLGTHSVYSTKTRKDGRYTMQGLPVGKYSVTAMLDSQAVEGIDSFDLKEKIDHRVMIWREFQPSGGVQGTARGVIQKKRRKKPSGFKDMLLMGMGSSMVVMAVVLVLTLGFLFFLFSEILGPILKFLFELFFSFLK